MHMYMLLYVQGIKVHLAIVSNYCHHICQPRWKKSEKTCSEHEQSSETEQQLNEALVVNKKCCF